MGYRTVPFAVDEWYHCYTRSIDRRAVYRDPDDYNRFTESLYLCNGNRNILRGTLYHPSRERLFSLKRGEPLVAVGAYCLMPNHFHLLLRQIADNGISTFMQKLGTSFAMYYNTKYERVGNVFVRPFRAKHVRKDDYFQHVAHYIHLNPVELFEPDWKKGKVGNEKVLIRKIQEYTYSSLLDYGGVKRLENAIINTSATPLLKPEISIKSVIREAAEYYQELNL